MTGPSEDFTRLTRNPKLAAEALRAGGKFEPTTKAPGDVVILSSWEMRKSKK
jgi:hypothetical protein